MLDRNEIALKIFNEIRDKPFRVALSANEPANNCYFKCMDLAKNLITLGYSVRGRLGEINWSDFPIPEDILNLYPNDTIDTHFYLEVFFNNDWIILDPTLNKNFAIKYDLPYSSFGKSNTSCFQITNLYNLDQQSAYTWQWLNDPEVIATYTTKTNKFFKALNSWLDVENPD